MGLRAILDYESLAADYAQYHRHPMNRVCHMIGIPLIMLAVVRWTQWPEVSYFPWAAPVLLLYAAWSVPLALAMASAVFAMAAVAPFMPSWAVWACFIAGWVFQFAGHGVFEKKSPAFARNLAHLLVGPIWVLGEILGPEPILRKE